MFYYLEGIVTHMAQNIAVIDINGAGYACMTTTNTLSHLENGKKARLYTYCNFKQDVFDIYGFYEQSERRCFEMLISVSGVGPRAALSILSSSTPETLAMAIVNDDESVLTLAPGIGKKIAQRVILELKDKVTKSGITLKTHAAAPSIHSAEVGNVSRDAVAALSVLGYSQSEISAALRHIDTREKTVEEIIKEVLANS